MDTHDRHRGLHMKKFLLSAALILSGAGLHAAAVPLSSLVLAVDSDDVRFLVERRGSPGSYTWHVVRAVCASFDPAQVTGTIAPLCRDVDIQISPTQNQRDFLRASNKSAIQAAGFGATP